MVPHFCLGAYLMVVSSNAPMTFALYYVDEGARMPQGILSVSPS